MLCWFFRFMISNAADSGGSIGRWASRHAAHCASCGQFLQSCRAIDLRLQSEAPSWQAVPIVAGIQSPGHVFRIRMALAAAACLAVGAAVVFFHTIPAKPPQVSSPAAAAIIPVDTPWTAKWVELIPNPLAAEAKNLTSDTESGIRFLVACLDVRPLAAGAGPRPGQSVLSPQ